MTIRNDDAKMFAYIIANDIENYIATHLVEYEEFLLEEKAKAEQAAPTIIKRRKSRNKM